MKKNYLLLMAVFIGTTFFTGCGKNEKKTSLLTGGTLGSGGGTPATKNSAASVAANSASMAARASGGAVSFAPHLAISRIGGQVPTGLSGPDGSGFYSFSAYTGTDMKIRFLDSAGSPIMGFDQRMAALAKINVVITSQYTFGIFQGNFTMLYSASSFETMESGTITTDDPVGGTFTATITNMIVEKQTIRGVIVGVPQSGSMTISGSSGYAGINTYSTVGSAHKCEGPIYFQGTEVAYVYLTFNDTFGNYTGYYTETSNPSVQITIQ